MRKKYIVLCGICIQIYANNIGVVAVSVADFFGQVPLQKRIPEYAIIKDFFCPRLHQGLYNEIVTIVAKKQSSVCIEVPNIYFITHSSDKPQIRYWTDSKNIRIIDNEESDIFEYIPDPISFKERNNSTKKIVTLQLPHYSKELQKNFSAGTRFVLASPIHKNKVHISVHAIDFNTLQPHKIFIEKEKCIVSGTHKNKPEQKNLFIQTLQKWCHQEEWIAYVWGGCSFIDTYSKPFRQIQATYKNNQTTLFTYGSESQIKTGFDCAGLLTRAAQIAGLPYYYKNSITIKKELTDVSHKRFKNGDIIWIPGHVLVISDVEKNRVIEARGYEHGYGKVHEIEIKNVFKKIDTIAELENTIKNKKPLYRIDTNGIEKNIYTQYQVLRI